jgi:putative FmdB family regulatory protein
MPTYEYDCQRCHRRHEAFQSITARPLSKCPRCGGRLRRLLGIGSGFLFKGSGFYSTDYRSKGYQQAKQKDTPATSSTTNATGSAGATPATSAPRAASATNAGDTA